MTTIEWTHVPGYRGDVWNPTTGCNKVSQGCRSCYAETMHRRLHAMGVKGYERPFLDGARPVPERLHKPLKTKTPTAYFVNSMSDLFHANVPFDYIDQVFAVMALCPQHIFLVLTKRPERMEDYLNDMLYRIRVEKALLALMDEHSLPTRYLPWIGVSAVAMSNVWLGTSVEDQATADARIPHLLKCPAAVRFLSCEPLLGAVSLRRKASSDDEIMRATMMNRMDDYSRSVEQGIDWVIAGGESGPKARPMHPDWARGLRDQCKAAGVPFFFKQWGEWVGGQFDRRKAKMICQEGTILNQLNGGRIFWCNPGAPKVHLWNEADHYWTNASAKVGRARAGRLLDGREHTEWPKVITPEPVEA